ncbi:MAG: ATP-binding protein [Gudongella sp.]|nr:ATP-binding protein [Gudongella sp.]
MSIESLIKNGEASSVEFKEDVPPDYKKYVKTIVAFSNTSGGMIIFGVDDDSILRGLPEEGLPRKRDSISDTISKVCVPVPDFDTEIVTVEDKSLIIVNVYPGPNRPYYLASEGVKNGTYVRIDGISKLADAATLKELQLEGKKDSFDAKINFDTEVTEEATNKICSDLSKIANAKITMQNLINERVIIKKGGDYVPTNAYALLQGNVFVFTEVKCALFKGLEKKLDKTMFLDRREYVGPIYQQIEDVYAFVLKNIRLESYYTGGIAREDEYEIPHDVIREVITNAVLHRSYIRSNMPTYVAIYDDRIEIISPGKLYGGITLEQMLEGKTERRNPVIGKIFALARISEGWGRGVKGIILECIKHDLKMPLFEEWGEDFKVTLYRRPLFKESDVTKEFTLLGTEYAVYNTFASNPEMSMSEVAETLNISLATVKRSVAELKEKGRLVREGGKGQGMWIVK